VNLYEQELENLERSFGPYDRSLLEPLDALISLHSSVDDFEEINSLLGRQLQLVHVTEGPNAFSQLPILESLIRNNLEIKNFESVTNNFENRQYVFLQNPDSTVEQKLASMDDLRNWYLTAFNLDNKQNRLPYFMKSRGLLQQMLAVASDAYEEKEERMVPLLYKEALEKYYLMTLLNSVDELGSDANDAIFVPERIQPMTYLRQGYEMVKDISDIVRLNGDKEAEGMATVYEADYQMLLGLGLARRTYQRAMDLFAEAGVQEQKIIDFFSRPTVIPTHEYYTSIDDAMSAQAADGYVYTEGEEGEDPKIHLGDYKAWNESVPFTPMPNPPDMLSDIELGLTRVDTRFRISSRGKTRGPDAETSDPESVRARRDAEDALKEMVFRPRFVGTRWRPIRNLTMTYWYPTEK
tara:strand:+ start:852 stop:2078 length:1227 start_codon:yes stop_codon:yes gene_type:complete